MRNAMFQALALAATLICAGLGFSAASEPSPQATLVGFTVKQSTLAQSDSQPSTPAAVGMCTTHPGIRQRCTTAFHLCMHRVASNPNVCRTEWDRCCNPTSPQPRPPH